MMAHAFSTRSWGEARRQLELEDQDSSVFYARGKWYVGFASTPESGVFFRNVPQATAWIDFQSHIRDRLVGDGEINARCGCADCDDSVQPGHFACERSDPVLVEAERAGLAVRAYNDGHWQWYSVLRDA